MPNWTVGQLSLVLQAASGSVPERNRSDIENSFRCKWSRASKSRALVDVNLNLNSALQANEIPQISVEMVRTLSAYDILASPDWETSVHVLPILPDSRHFVSWFVLEVVFMMTIALNIHANLTEQNGRFGETVPKAGASRPRWKVAEALVQLAGSARRPNHW